MTDFLWNDLGAVIAALLDVRAYCHWIGPRHRQNLGGIANGLIDGQAACSTDTAS